MFQVIERIKKTTLNVLDSFDSIEAARLDTQRRNDICYRMRTPKCIYIQYPRMQ